MMYLQLVLILLISDEFVSDSTGCIMGRYWRDGEQRIEYTSRLASEGLTVESDSNGIFVFPHLVPGIYRVSDSQNRVEVVAGDTTYADIASHEGFNNQVLRNELQFRINTEEEISLNGFVIYGGTDRYRRLPYSIASDGIISVRVPVVIRNFIWSLPKFPEQRFALRDCPAVRQGVNELYLSSDIQPPWQEELQLLQSLDVAGYPLALSDSEMYEFTADGGSIYHFVRSPVNCMNLPHRHGTSISVNANLEKRMVSLCLSIINLVNTNYEIDSYRLERFESMWTSPSGEHALLVFREFEEWHHYHYSWLYMNTITGESRQIDLFPELEPGEETGILRYSSDGYVGVSAWIYIADDGSIIAKYRDNGSTFAGSRDNLRTYSPEGEQMQNIDLLNFNCTKLVFSEDCTTWAYMYNEEDKTIVLIGDSDSFSRLNTGSLNRGLGLDISPHANYLVLYGRANGLWLYDLRTEETNQIFSSGRVLRNSVVFSPDESKIACKVIGNYQIPNGEFSVDGISSCTVFDLTTSAYDTVVSFPDYSLVYTGVPIALADDGCCVMMSLCERGNHYINRIRVALVDDNAELVWLSHYIDTNTSAGSRFGNWGKIFAGGKICIYGDGDQIHYLFLNGGV